MMTMMTPLGKWGVWDFNDDMMTKQNKVAAAIIYHPLPIICIHKVTLFASTNLSLMALYGSGLVQPGL